MSGVLSNSSIIRNKHLQENLGLYKAYDGTINGSSYYSFNTKPLKRINEGSLYDYTHNEHTEYSKNIGNLYFKNRTDFQPYINIDPINPRNFWGGEYHDYYDYVNVVYTQITPPIQFIEGLLSTQFLDEAMRVTSPAIVHNPEPSLSIAGVVKTNVNNFSGTDTRTGLLGNQMYAHALFHGANFNTLRKDSPSFIYNAITPTVQIRFGNSNYTINSLSSIVSAIRSDGKIIEDYNEGIQIYDDISNLSGDINPMNLFQNLYRGSNYQYNKFGKETSFDTDNDIFIEYNSEKISPLYQSGKLNDVTQHLVYSDNNTTLDTSDVFNPKTVEVVPEHETEFDEYDYILDRNADLSKNSLLFKTNNLFREHKINNFGFGGFYDFKYENTTIDSTAINGSENGRGARSRGGRNLIKKKWGSSQGYTNPFCRTWTYHHQYDTLDKLIRPLSDDDGRIMSINDIQELNKRFRSKHVTTIKNEDGTTSSTITFNETGGEYLANNTVLNNNGFVQITPHRNGNVDIKKYMFSIENLAWKDVLDKDVYLSKEQRGPNGGRIMWFPPYDLSFQENTNVNWEQNTFIGRGEKIYTYSNTDRTGSLSFTLLIDHPSTIHNIYEGENLRQGITDEDILRFFAGCGPIEPPTIIEKKTKEETKAKTVVLPKTETKTIYVYFPNNYSGHYKSKVTEESKNTTTQPDDDFLEYMLFGTNAAYFNDAHESMENGYEISDNGLLYEVEDLDWIYERTTIPVCKNYELYKDCTDINDKIKYFYRVDNDLRQTLNSSNNYKDKYSYHLNSKNGEGDYQFIELAYILAKDDVKNKIAEKFPEVTGTTLANIFSDKNINRIINISFKGSASDQDRKNSVVLASRRASTMRSLITEKYPSLKQWCLLERYNIGSTKEGEKSNVFSEDVKKMRFVRIEITYMLDETEELVTGYVTKNIEYEEDVTEAKLTKTYNDDDKSIEYRRYETESEYFSNLQVTDPSTFRRLTDKFKYFTPAFHSVSPEGFNARLTFLQQCTRQGHTIEPIIKQGVRQEIAGNLAFGRMPVCVLRIGDFIYTKILINSVTINYGKEGMQWDLNPEGVGVQPMLATVNLSITILGGQSLEGPISRLQNAVSFNYYANAGVYDDRADRARPSKTGEGQWSTDYYYAWTPEAQNKTETSKKIIPLT